MLASPALHSFSPDPNDDQQISLSAGDELNDVMSIGNGWSEGVNVGTGQKGVFPSSYVEILDVAAPPPPPPQAVRVSSPRGVRLICLYLNVLPDKDQRIKFIP